MATADHDTSTLENELLILREVFVNELESVSTSESSTIIDVVIKPNTCDDPEKQFIKFLLSFSCENSYPSLPPVITIKQARGLTEEEVIQLKLNMDKIGNEKVGDQMLFDIILYAKEYITDQNIPHTVCCICLDGFTDENGIFKTPQFHFYHNQCIAKYFRYETDRHRSQVDELLSHDPYIKTLPKLSILCPFCREEEIECSQEFVKKYDTPFETVEVVIPDEWKQKSKELQALFEKQLRLTEESLALSAERQKNETEDAIKIKTEAIDISENCNTAAGTDMIITSERYSHGHPKCSRPAFRSRRHRNSEFPKRSVSNKLFQEESSCSPQKINNGGIDKAVHSESHNRTKRASLKCYDAKPRLSCDSQTYLDRTLSENIHNATGSEVPRYESRVNYYAGCNSHFPSNRGRRKDSHPKITDMDPPTPVSTRDDRASYSRCSHRNRYNDQACFPNGFNGDYSYGRDRNRNGRRNERKFQNERHNNYSCRGRHFDKNFYRSRMERGGDDRTHQQNDTSVQTKESDERTD